MRESCMTFYKLYMFLVVLLEYVLTATDRMREIGVCTSCMCVPQGCVEDYGILGKKPRHTRC